MKDIVGIALDEKIEKLNVELLKVEAEIQTEKGTDLEDQLWDKKFDIDKQIDRLQYAKHFIGHF